MKIKQLTIRAVQVLGGTGNVRLTFANQKPTHIAIKPISVLCGRLDPLTRSIVETSPSMLVGAAITVEDSNFNDIITPAVMETFEAGDDYVLTEINSKVTNGEINPATNAPYKAGETAKTVTAGIRINGNINLELDPTVTDTIEKTVIAEGVREAMAMRKSKASPSVSRTQPVRNELASDIDDAINQDIDQHINAGDLNANINGEPETAENAGNKGKSKKK